MTLFPMPDLSSIHSLLKPGQETNLIEKCWSENPHDRPESFAQIRDVLIKIHETRRSKKSVCYALDELYI